MKTFVIAGCGRLAGIVSEAVVKGLLPEYELVGVYSRTVAKAERIAGRMAEAGKSCAVCTTADELLALKPDILVETASPAALREFAVPALKNGTSIVTLSIGALADDAFYREVCETAKENGTRIYIASGATGGFDVLRTAALYTSTTACTWSFLISTRWVSPLNPGVDCMVTCMASGPTEAREAATVTFTFVGNRRMASTALPVNTTFCSFCKASS